MEALTQQELDRWLAACAADPSIVTPWEMGYQSDGGVDRQGGAT